VNAFVEVITSKNEMTLLKTSIVANLVKIVGDQLSISSDTLREHRDLLCKNESKFNRELIIQLKTHNILL